jgi:hypothetical protein
MANTYESNSDRILQAVLMDENLINYGSYNPEDYNNLYSALEAENPVVRTVAQIIDNIQHNNSSKQVYNEVTNYLKSNMI